MNVLVDTSIWSEALRRNKPKTNITSSLTKLIQNYQAVIIGPIKQELLSGYSDSVKFNTLKEKLSSFPNQEILDQDYIQAAEFSNSCRIKGIQGSNTDFLICAVAHRLDLEIFTTDKDFESYKAHIPIKIYENKN